MFKNYDPFVITYNDRVTKDDHENKHTCNTLNIAFLKLFESYNTFMRQLWSTFQFSGDNIIREH